MPGHQFATDSRDQQEAGSGYFAPVERARHMLLTTFERGGSAVSAPVSGVADGDRAYFWTWSGSASARLLQHTDAVQVTPCSTRGFITYGLPLNATARLLDGGEASRATGKLASKHPVQHRFLILLLQRARRRQMMIYELLADDAQGQHVGGFRAPDRRGDQSGGHAVDASGEVVRVYWVRTHVTDCGVASIACIWPTSSRELAVGEGSRPAGTVTGTRIHTATCCSAPARPEAGHCNVRPSRHGPCPSAAGLAHLRGGAGSYKAGVSWRPGTAGVTNGGHALRRGRSPCRAAWGRRQG